MPSFFRSFYSFAPVEGSMSVNPPFCEEVFVKVVDQIEVGADCPRIRDSNVPVYSFHVGFWVHTNDRQVFGSWSVLECVVYLCGCRSCLTFGIEAVQFTSCLE